MRHNCVRKYPKLLGNKRKTIYNCFLQTFLWKHRRHFRKLWQKVLAKGYKPCPEKFLNDLKSNIFSKNLFSSKCFSGYRECILDNYNKKIWQKVANIALSVIKTFKVELPFKTIIFIKLLLWTLVCISDNTDKNLLAGGGKYFFLCPQIIKDNWKFFWEKNIFSLQMCFCTRRSPFLQPCQSSLVKLPIVFWTAELSWLTTQKW